jgi:hypothetical protein
MSKLPEFGHGSTSGATTRQGVAGPRVLQFVDVGGMPRLHRPPFTVPFRCFSSRQLPLPGRRQANDMHQPQHVADRESEHRGAYRRQTEIIEQEDGEGPLTQAASPAMAP